MCSLNNSKHKLTSMDRLNKYLSIAQDFAKERKVYREVKKELELEKKLKVIETKETKRQNYYANEPLNYEDLEIFYQNIDKEYDSIDKEKISKYEGGIPYADLKKYWEIDLPTPQDKYDISLKYNRRHEKPPKTPSSLTAGENCKIFFQKCLAKLREFNISIYHVDINLDSFKNSNWSSLCVNTPPFLFFCKKGNWEFKVEFNDDCDVKGGLLYVRKVVHSPSNETFELGTNLFGKNRSVTDFLILIESANYNEFRDTRFSHLLELPKLLNERGYTIIQKNNLIPNNVIKLNDYELPYRFEIKIDGRGLMQDGFSLMVLLNPIECSSSFQLSVGKSIKDIREEENKKYRFSREDEDDEDDEYFEVNGYNQSYDVGIRYNVEYNNIDDIGKVVECIEDRIRFVTSESPHISTITDFLETLKKKNESKKLGLYWNDADINLFTGPELNTLCTLSFGNLEGYKENVNDLPFSYESWKLRVWYDPKNDLDKEFHLRIQGGRKDLKDDAKLYEICNEIFHGNFDEIFEIFSQFITQLVEFQ